MLLHKLCILAVDSAPAPIKDHMTDEDWWHLFIALAILMGLVIIGGAAILIARNRLNATSDSGSDVGFSLSDLRKLRDKGEITPEEYEVARNRVVKNVRSSLEKKPKTPPDATPGESL